MLIPDIDVDLTDDARIILEMPNPRTQCAYNKTVKVFEDYNTNEMMKAKIFLDAALLEIVILILLRFSLKFLTY